MNQRRFRVVSTGLAMVALAFLAAPAHADEGRIPLWEQVVLDSTVAGVDLTGKYIVTENLQAGAGTGPVLTIICDGQDEVDINLNGFTLFGDPAGAPIVEATDCRSLTLRNGSLRGTAALADNLFVANSATVIVMDLRIANGGVGINIVDPLDIRLTGNVISQAGQTAIFVESPGGTVFSGSVERNQVTEAAGAGIVLGLGNEAVSVSHNRVDRTNGGPGIALRNGMDCLLVENIVTQAESGIVIDSMNNCKLYNNVTSKNQVDGIRIQSSFDGLVKDNLSSQNGGSGIEHTSERFRFDGNVLNQNGCWGMHLAGRANTYGRNAAEFNNGAAVCPGACGVAPVEVCPAPYGGGAFPPDFCVDAIDNVSFCDNLMPGPPRS